MGVTQYINASLINFRNARPAKKKKKKIIDVHSTHFICSPAKRSDFYRLWKILFLKMSENYKLSKTNNLILLQRSLLLVQLPQFFLGLLKLRSLLLQLFLSDFFLVLSVFHPLVQASLLFRHHH